MVQESKSAVKDGSASASKGGSVPKEVQPSSGPVTEDEIRAVLMQKSPVTTQDLVAKFKARLKSSKVGGVLFIYLFFGMLSQYIIIGRGKMFF